ncbi:hypothetical protein [Devosia sp.]|uniref:hypothetical protein n=1 Tax=Devosia sp. TaxID=1871048 RepID=UPI003264C30F
MTQNAPQNMRFEFVTQRPRDDGCGIFVLQMLTGKPYDQIASMIDWGAQKNHYTTWKELQGVLSQLGWRADAIRSATRWDDIDGVAIVHVEPDHFVLYDADNSVFYDPGQPEGPELSSRHTPMSYLRVQPPQAVA